MSLKTNLLKLEREIDKIYDRYLVSEVPIHAQLEIEKLEAEANEIAEQLSVADAAYEQAQQKREIEQRELRLKERITTKHGDFTKWWEWAISLYIVEQTSTGLWFVTSKARDWNDEMSWGGYVDRISALEKVEELINYKINDRNRGHGNIEKDLA